MSPLRDLISSSAIALGTPVPGFHIRPLSGCIWMLSCSAVVPRMQFSHTILLAGLSSGAAARLDNRGRLSPQET